jgi:CubicO group peptidase (beta-lactamase class C family)
MKGPIMQKNGLHPAALAIALALPAAFAFAQDKDCGKPADLHDGWRTAAPAEAGLDPKLLCAIGPRFEAWKDAHMHSVVVVRKGVLVYERYFAGEDERGGMPIGRVEFNAATKHDLRSISKSVTALVVGIALERGWIKSVDAPVFSFFPEYADLKTPEKERLTLRHLLTMSAGFAWNEQIPYSNPANSDRQMFIAPDPLRHLLSRPLAAAPGRDYNYNSGATALLGAIVAKAAGKPFDAVAQETLFDPLGIADVDWVRFPKGEPVAGWGLRLRPRDLAKIGQLVLAKGAWQGKQIVPAAWIADATTPHINGEGLYFYGYQYWLGRSLVADRAIAWAAGFGWGGQRLFVVPGEDLVVVVHAGLYHAQNQSIVGATVLNRHVLPAIVKP